jgi:ubiquinone/menaquinone biosynthesis C-methylase UbiE
MGIDTSTEKTTRARAKAAKAAINIDFRTASAEALPFSDATFRCRAQHDHSSLPARCCAPPMH